MHFNPDPSAIRTSHYFHDASRSHSVHTAFTLFTLFFKGGGGVAIHFERRISQLRASPGHATNTKKHATTRKNTLFFKGGWGLAPPLRISEIGAASHLKFRTSHLA